uniref:Uncharacterized protein n=1 Tax=Arundo donax TaxID=35708 RepID=A0A0A9F2Y3_ARUDO
MAEIVCYWIGGREGGRR